MVNSPSVLFASLGCHQRDDLATIPIAIPVSPRFSSIRLQ
jgi:hypothetical protein